MCGLLTSTDPIPQEVNSVISDLGKTRFNSRGIGLDRTKSPKALKRIISIFRGLNK